MAQRSERDVLRERNAREIERLEDPDLDEVSEAQLEDVADRAAKRAAQLSRPDAEEAAPGPWHQRPVARVGGVVALLSALGAVLEALRQLGLLK